MLWAFSTVARSTPTHPLLERETPRYLSSRADEKPKYQNRTQGPPMWGPLWLTLLNTVEPWVLWLCRVAFLMSPSCLTKQQCIWSRRRSSAQGTKGFKIFFNSAQAPCVLTSTQAWWEDQFACSWSNIWKNTANVVSFIWRLLHTSLSWPHSSCPLCGLMTEGSHIEHLFGGCCCTATFKHPIFKGFLSSTGQVSLEYVATL